MVQWAWRGNRRKWERAARVLLALLLVVALAYVIARTLWLVGYGPEDRIPSAQLRQVSVGSGGQIDTTLSQSQVNDWRLFGTYQRVPTRKDKVEAPETRLQLELLGLFLARDPDRSTAIIAQQGQEARLYHIGDEIPGNATLEHIYADRVILRRKGRLETLRFDSLEALSGVTQVMRSAALSSSTSVPAQTPAPPSASTGTPAPASTPRKDLAKQRKMLVRRLGLEPVAPGAANGYVIGEQAPAKLINQVGLEQGDVIVSVNGYPLGTRQSDLAALQSYQDTQTATIVIKRGDQLFTVNYPP